MVSTGVAAVVVGVAVAPPVVTIVVAGGAGVMAAARTARRISDFPTDPSDRGKSRPQTTAPGAGIVVFATTVGLVLIAVVFTAASKLFPWAIDAVRSAREGSRTT